MDDSALLTAFERGEVRKEDWTHESHLREGFLLLESSSCRDEAIDRMRRGVRALNEAHHTPSVGESGYHETITGAWIRIIDHARGGWDGDGSSMDFIADHPHLADKRKLHEHYTRDRLVSDEARATFLAPDREPLPTSDA